MFTKEHAKDNRQVRRIAAAELFTWTDEELENDLKVLVGELWLLLGIEGMPYQRVSKQWYAAVDDERGRRVKEKQDA
jgi:hypothetical protein